MRLADRLFHALTLSGFGLAMWYGIGYPVVLGPAALFITSLIALLILCKPIFEIWRGPSGALDRLNQSFGRRLPYLGAVTLVLLVIYMTSIEQLARNGTLGFVITGLSTLFTVLHGLHRTNRSAVFQRIVETLLILGYTGTAGALLAGQVQLSIAAILALALLQLFRWFVFGRANGGPGGILFAFLIPLGMLISLRIGHGLAVPLVLSFTLGFSLNLPSAKEEFQAPQE